MFLGDYINKGAESAEVMRELLAYRRARHATLLLGNHEAALLEALDTGDLMAFLKMGGAMTIRSYVGRNVGPDVLLEFRTSFPSEHLNAIRCMPATFRAGRRDRSTHGTTRVDSKFRISAHIPVGKLPPIEHHSAHLDTGCGTHDGRLTALLWPSLTYIQVDGHGAVVTR